MTARSCVITGASGYVGGALARAFRAAGWRVLGLARGAHDGAGISWQRWELGTGLPPEAEGADLLVHAAWDLAPPGRAAAQATNVAGSWKLWRAARHAGVRRLAFLSTISAYEGCRSIYGQTKLAAEADALAEGALVVRPGLVYGSGAGGMFGRLLSQIERRAMAPIFGGGNQSLYLVHAADLAAYLLRCADAGEPPNAPITTAHPTAWAFKRLLQALAEARARRLLLVPVPWRPLWLMLRIRELSGRPGRFRSDSLLSLMYQNPAPAFGAPEPWRFQGRVFDPSSVS